MSSSRARRFSGRLAIAAVLSALLLPGVLSLSGAQSGAQAAVPAAKPKTGSSWKIVRTEGFSGSALPTGCEAYTGKYIPGKNAWSSKDVVVSGGLLQLKLEKKKTSGQPYTAGGVGCWGWPQKYGKYEIKAKVPVGKGIDSSLTLWPAKASKTSAAAFTGLELMAPGPETAYLTNGYGTKSESAQVVGKYSGKVRTYVIEWAPKHIRMTVNGKEIYFSTHSYTGSRWLGLVVSNGDALTGVPDADTKLPAKLQIDSVKIWSYTGVRPKPGTITPTATPAPSPAVAAASPTVSPRAAAPAPAPTIGGTALEATSAETGPVLAGGVWPWLLGGSLIAVFAIATLNYPHYRRANQAGPPLRQ
jgi:beta-glucanase (GH16 family)